MKTGARRRAKVTWADVRRIAIALPGTSERASSGHAQWRVGDKLFVWERPLRKSDLEALGELAPKGPILGVRVPDLSVKEMALAAKPGFLFTIPHFDGYPAVLVQLDRVPLRELEDLIDEAWHARATKSLLRASQPKSLEQQTDGRRKKSSLRTGRRSKSKR